MYCLQIDTLGKKKRCIRALIRHSCQSLFPELIFYHKHVSLFDRSVSLWLENHIQSLLTKFSNDIDPEIGLRWLSSKLRYGKLVRLDICHEKQLFIYNTCRRVIQTHATFNSQHSQLDDKIGGSSDNNFNSTDELNLDNTSIGTSDNKSRNKKNLKKKESGRIYFLQNQTT